MAGGDGDGNLDSIDGVANNYRLDGGVQALTHALMIQTPKSTVRLD